MVIYGTQFLAVSYSRKYARHLISTYVLCICSLTANQLQFVPILKPPAEADEANASNVPKYRGR